jgi:hypothetical protein
MKTYTIKYETHSGDVLTIELQAFSKQDVIRMLTNCKIIYWIK